jgi:predicted DNA-binding transcriptional regulator AlpA
MMNETKQREREPLAYDVTGFCAAVGISRSLFYDLQRNGEGPRVTKLGDRHRRSLILASDARTWLLKQSVTTAIDREVTTAKAAAA